MLVPFVGIPVGLYSMITYEKLNGKIEKLCKWFCYAICVQITFSASSALFLTIVNFYILNEGKESFFLNIPTMYVRLSMAT